MKKIKTLITVSVLCSLSAISFGETKAKTLPARVKNVNTVTSDEESPARLKGRIDELQRILKEKDDEIIRLKSQKEFDKVTEEQIPILKERLELVQEILSKQKKAYDYRSSTTKELKDILGPKPKAESKPEAKIEKETKTIEATESPKATIQSDLNSDSEEKN